MPQARHSLVYCPTFKAKPDKRSFVLEQKLCFNCLKGNHISKKCLSHNSCFKCGKRHRTLLHINRDFPETSRENNPTVSSDTNASQNPEVGNTTPYSTISSATCVSAPEANPSGSVLMMTAEVILTGSDGQQMVARALLDPASTASFVTERGAQHLKLRGQKQTISINGIGGTQCATQSNTVVNLNVASTQQPMTLTNVRAIVLPSLTKCLPLSSIPMSNWPHLSSLKLADPEFNISKPIDVLLGIDIYQNILKPGLILGPRGTPAAQETVFGWVLFGNTSNYQPTSKITTLHVSTSIPSCEETVQIFWTLEEPPKAKLRLSSLNKLAIQDYNKRHRDETGRFVVRLPFKPHKPALGQSQPKALRCFLSLERRLKSTNEFKDYAKVIDEYFTSDHAERVPESDLNKPTSDAFYLAHHAVYKDSTITPIRVVFDGSIKSSSGVSLNDQLLVGPTRHPPLNDVLIHFQRHPYVLTTDVSKMYRAISLAPEDRDHRFLWRSNSTDPVVNYRMTRVTFGIARAAFLVTNSVQRLAEEKESELPLASKAVKESLYLDDGLPSVETEKAILLHQQLQELFDKGGFKLHKWDSNSQNVLKFIPPELRTTKAISTFGNSNSFVKTLGMEYSSSQDHFQFSSTKLSTENHKLTKCALLSDSAKIFNPLGLISCVTVVVKIIFQQLWKHGTTWAEPLPQDILKEWLTWRRQLPEISNLRIPRCYSPVNTQIADRQLVGFSNAIEKAYCGVVYLRSVDTAGGVHTSLVMTKTCVAPIKKVSLPRLELCGTHLLAQLMKHLQNILAVPRYNMHAFTDSTIVFCWIQGNSHSLKTFEGNTVREIQEHVPPKRWNPVDGKENPADLGSHGISPAEIGNHKLWWNGPDWLIDVPSSWPSRFTSPPSLETFRASGIKEEALQLKNTKEVALQTVTTKAKPVIDIQRYSSFTHLVRITAWVFRIVTRSYLFMSMPLSAGELSQAKFWLIKQSQAETFPITIEALKRGKPLLLYNSLHPWNPFLDADGLLRVGGRLSQSKKAYQSRHPLILHGKHHLTTLTIQNEHLPVPRWTKTHSRIITRPLSHHRRLQSCSQVHTSTAPINRSSTAPISVLK